MIDKLHRSIVTMNSRDLLVNILMLLCIFILKKTEVESAAQGAAEPIHDDLKKEMDDVTIKCKVEGITSYRVVWQKDGETLEGDRYVRNDEEVEKALTIKKASRKDVGEYTCVFIPDPASAGAGNVSATPIVKSGPFVDPFHGSVSPWQGDEVVLTCKVYGNPMPDVSWTKDGEAIANSTKSEYSAYNGVENAQLTIRDLVAADRANYGCVASRTGFNSTKEEILVRVKDRYAAMWPFIGILIEVIILVVVIFIYERRKGKTSDDDSDSGGKTNSHDQRAGGDVRQRNTVRT